MLFVVICDMSKIFDRFTLLLFSVSFFSPKNPNQSSKIARTDPPEHTRSRLRSFSRALFAPIGNVKNFEEIFGSLCHFYCKNAFPDFQSSQAYWKALCPLLVAMPFSTD